MSTAALPPLPPPSMSAELELLWPLSGLLLLLLGATAWLCVRCSRPGKCLSHRPGAMGGWAM